MSTEPKTAGDPNAPILEVKNLKKYFKTSARMLHAVADVRQAQQNFKSARL